MKPFSDNLIFWDSEFTSLDPMKGELISIGMVKNSGEELYLELAYNGQMNPWVKENVIPHLSGKKITRVDARSKITHFIGDNEPYLVSYVMTFDTIYLYKLFHIHDENTNKDMPFHWISLDFASFLFTLGYDPESFGREADKTLVQTLGIDANKYRAHHALDDAKLLNVAYNTLLQTAHKR